MWKHKQMKLQWIKKPYQKSLKSVSTVFVTAGSRWRILTCWKIVWSARWPSTAPRSASKSTGLSCTRNTALGWQWLFLTVWISTNLQSAGAAWEWKKRLKFRFSLLIVHGATKCVIVSHQFLFLKRLHFFKKKFLQGGFSLAQDPSSLAICCAWKNGEHLYPVKVYSPIRGWLSPPFKVGEMSGNFQILTSWFQLNVLKGM